MFQTIKYHSAFIHITTEGSKTTARAQFAPTAETAGRYSKDFPSLRACKDWVRKEEKK